MNPIAEIIKYEGDNSTFIWKHPCEDFNSTTQLIVHETQEALFYLNGQALDLFGPGRYTLETENIPILRKVINLPTGGETPFHCEVYFINKTEQMAILWGTESKIEYIEPNYKFPIKIGASGEMSLRADDSRRLLIKVVGTERDLTQPALVQKFRAFLMLRVKTYLAQLIKAEKLNIFEIDEKLTEMSASLQKRLSPDFSDYGIVLERFFLTTIVKPEDDATYIKFKELHYRQYAEIAEAELRQKVGVIEQQTEAQRMKIEAGAVATKRQIEGYTYQQERGFDVAQDAASNEGSGQFASMGIGLGMMAGVGPVVGGAVGNAVGNAFGSIGSAEQSTAGFCENCEASLEAGAVYCSSCGAKVRLEAVCGKCGFAFSSPGKYCPKCGTKRES